MTPKDKHWSPHRETNQEGKYGHDEDFGVIRHFGQTSEARKLYKIKSDEGGQLGNASKKIRQDVGPFDVEVEEAFHHLEVACAADHDFQRQKTKFLATGKRTEHGTEQDLLQSWLPAQESFAWQGPRRSQTCHQLPLARHLQCLLLFPELSLPGPSNL